MVCRFRHDERRQAGSSFNIKNYGANHPMGLINSALPRGSELPTAPSAVPARPASEDVGQPARAIIPGDDPGDQQPPKSTPLPSRLT